MNLVELLQIASSEEKAEEFLREKGVLKTFDSCPFCHAKNVGKIRRNFYINLSQKMTSFYQEK
jgi:transposase